MTKSERQAYARMNKREKIEYLLAGELTVSGYCFDPVRDDFGYGARVRGVGVDSQLFPTKWEAMKHGEEFLEGLRQQLTAISVAEGVDHA